MYKVLNDDRGDAVAVLLDGKTSIPFAPANTDAVEFAKWLKNGNIPEPAVEGETVSQEWIQETIKKLLP